MKHILLTLLLLVAPFVARAETSTGPIKQAAQKCVKDFLAKDYDGFLASMPKKIIELGGGKEATIGLIKNAMAELHAKGVEITDVSVGEPEEPKKMGTLLTALVPQKTTMKVSGGHVTQNSKLLAVSEDSGKTWAFVDVGPITKEQLFQFYPELEGKFTLPEKTAPVFEKD